MKNYKKPELTVNEFESMDIIQTSSGGGGLVDGGEGGGSGTIVIPDPEPQTKKYWNN